MPLPCPLNISHKKMAAEHVSLYFIFHAPHPLNFWIRYFKKIQARPIKYH